jgi:hypothetical protein
MTGSDSDEAVVRSAFDDLRVGVPSPAPTRLAAMEATVRRRRTTRLVAASALVVTALVVTPAVIARGGPAAAPEDPVAGLRTKPATQAAQPGMASCPAKAATRGVDLTVTASNLVMGPVWGEQTATRRRGDMVVRVCNAGGVTAPAGTMTLRWLSTIPPDVQVGTASWKGCRYGEKEQDPAAGNADVTYNVAHCDYPELASGAAREYMFLFEMPGGADPAFDQPLAQYAQVSTTGDMNGGNNRATFKTQSADSTERTDEPACKAKPRPQGADLAIVASPLTLGPPPNGDEPRRGDMSITFCNIGRAEAPAGTMTLRWLSTIPPDDPMGTGSWEGCRYGKEEQESTPGKPKVTYSVAHCGYPALAAGASRQDMFLFEIPGGARPAIDRPVSQYARISDAGDVNTRNNKVTFKITSVE